MTSLVSLARFSSVALTIGALTVGCGGKGATGPAEPTGGTPVKIKRVTLSFTSTDATPMGAVAKKSAVYLQLTDENGQAVSHQLGTFDGTCTAAAPGSDAVLAAMRCWAGDHGADLGVSAQRNQIIVTRLWIKDGVQPDPYAIVELSRLSVELGTKIEGAPL